MQTINRNTEGRSRLFPLAALLVLTASAAWGLSEHVITGGTSPGQLGQTSPYYLYSQHALTQSSAVNLPGTSQPTNGVPDSARGTTIMTVKKGGVNYALIRSFYRLEIYTVKSVSPLDLLPQTAYEIDYTFPGRPNDAVYATLLSADQQTLYLGVGTTNNSAYFQSIWKVDIGSLPNITWAPTLVADLKRSNGNFADCYSFDRVGTQMVVACAQGELFKVDLSTTNSVTNNTNQSALLNYLKGTLRMEPTQGNFAYLNGAQSAPYDMLAINLSTFALTSIPTPNGGSRVGGIFFHPSGKWAYVAPANAFHAIDFVSGVGLLTSTNSGGTLQPAMTMTQAIPGGFATNRSSYNGIASNTKLYLSTSEYGFLVMNINTSTGELTPQPLIPVDRGLWGIGLFELDTIPITVDTNLPTAHFPFGSTTSMDLAAQVDASITQGTAPVQIAPAMVSGTILAGGSQAYTGVSKTSVPAGPTERFDLANWQCDTGPDTTPTTTPSRPITVQPTPGTNYKALYDRYAYIEVVNNGCASTSFGTGWYKNGAPPVATGTPPAGWRVRWIEIEQPFQSPGTSTPPVINGTDIAQLLGGSIQPGTKLTFVCELDVVTMTVRARRTDGSILNVPITVTLKNGTTSAPIGSNTATYSSTQVPAGLPIIVEATPVSSPLNPPVAGYRWRFIHWLRNGNIIPGSALPSTSTATITSYNGATAVNGDIFTAVYRDEAEIKVVSDGGCTVTSPASGWYDPSVVHNIVVAPASPKHMATITVPPGPSNTWNLANPLPTVPNMTLTVTCGIVTIKHVANPFLGTNVSITLPTGNPIIGFGSSGVNQTALDLPAGSGVFRLNSDTGKLVGNTYHTRTSITAGSPSPTGTVVANPNSVPTPAVDTTYYSNYAPGGYTLTFSNLPGCSAAPAPTPAPLQLSPLVYATGTVVTIAGVSTANLPVTYQINSGGTTTTSTANPLHLTITAPTVVTPVCGGTPKLVLTPIPTVIRDTTVTPNQWLVTVKLANQGTAPVTGVTVTAKLAFIVNPIVAIPVAIGTIAPNGTATALFRFAIGTPLLPGATLPLNVVVKGSPVGANSTTVVKLQ